MHPSSSPAAKRAVIKKTNNTPRTAPRRRGGLGVGSTGGEPFADEESTEAAATGYEATNTRTRSAATATPTATITDEHRPGTRPTPVSNYGDADRFVAERHEGDNVNTHNKMVIGGGLYAIRERCAEDDITAHQHQRHHYQETDDMQRWRVFIKRPRSSAGERRRHERRSTKNRHHRDPSWWVSPTTTPRHDLQYPPPPPPPPPPPDKFTDKAPTIDENAHHRDPSRQHLLDERDSPRLARTRTGTTNQAEHASLVGMFERITKSARVSPPHATTRRPARARRATRR
ncbi:hypothetical protein pipiens_019937 [Culex pipiens pipiens]|uniref:Uncharacterized protein n=1 Tax=Culex pipiens pipiens TaxID=38569 RepID=A0ABD1DQ49_CULPP